MLSSGQEGLEVLLGSNVICRRSTEEAYRECVVHKPFCKMLLRITEACFYLAAVQHSEVIIWEVFHGYFSSSLRKLKIVMTEHGFRLNPWYGVAYNWCQ